MKKRHYQQLLLGIFLLLSLGSNAQNREKILQAKQSIKETEWLPMYQRLYPNISIAALVDSLKEIEATMEAKLRDMQEVKGYITSDSIRKQLPNYYPIYYTLISLEGSIDRYDKMQKGEYYRGYSYYMYWFSMICIEKKDWKSLWQEFRNNGNYKADTYAEFKQYILPKLPKNAPIDWDLWTKATILSGSYIDTETKDNPMNLLILKWADSLYTLSRQPTFKKMFSKSDLYYIYNNTANERDTLVYVLEDSTQASPRPKAIYYQLLYVLESHYQMVAQGIEDLSRVKNGYILPIETFLKTEIESSKSPYLRALALTKELMQLKNTHIVFTKGLDADRLLLADVWLEGKPNYCEDMYKMYTRSMAYFKYDSAYSYVPDALGYALLLSGFLTTQCPDLAEKEKDKAFAALRQQTNDSLRLRQVLDMQARLHLGIKPEIWKQEIEAILPSVKSPEIALLLRYQLIDYSVAFIEKSRGYQRSDYEEANYYIGKSDACLILGLFDDFFLENGYKQLYLKDLAKFSTIYNLYYFYDGYKRFGTAANGFSVYDAVTLEYLEKYEKLPYICADEYSRLGEKALLWLDKKAFANAPLSLKEREDPNLFRAALYQQLIQNQDKNVFLFWENERILFLDKQINEGNSDYDVQRLSYLQALKNEYDKYENVCFVYEQLIDQKIKLAGRYNPQYASTHAYRFYRRDATEILKEFKRKHPNSNYFSYKNINYKGSSLGANYPSHVAPNQAFQVLAYIENIDTVFVHIQKLQGVNRGDYRIVDLPHDTLFEAITFAIGNTNKGDMYKHEIELLMPALEVGEYRIRLASCRNFWDSDCSPQGLYVTVSPVWLLGQRRQAKAWNNSGIKDKKFVYVLDRASGKPLENIEVLYKHIVMTRRDGVETYQDFDSIPYESIKVRDSKDGIWLPDYIRGLAVVMGKDTFFNIANYTDAIRFTEIPATRVEVFTDRAVYRAGQTVYFKMIAAQSNEGKTEVLGQTDYALKLVLRNAKGKVILSAGGYLGTFGDVVSDFVLPEDLMGGIYYLDAYDSAEAPPISQLSKTIKVEAYKRPSFEVKHLPIERPYMVGDTVCLQSQVNAFAGYPIAGAEVKYEINARLDAPYYEISLDELVDYDYNGNPIYKHSSQYFVLKSETKTDDKGGYEVCFPAEKRYYHSPSMNYEFTVKAVISDAKGETQESRQSVNLSERALAVSIDAPEYAEAGGSIAISVTDAQGNARPTDLRIQLYQLKNPKHYKNYRLWGMPTDTALSAAALAQQAPHAPHWQEDIKENWAYQQLVLKDSASATADYSLVLPKKMAQGEYAVVVQQRGSDGNWLDKKQCFTVMDWKSNDLPSPHAFWTKGGKTIYQKNENLELYIGSSQPDAHVLVYVSRLDSVFYHQWHRVSGKQKLEIPLANMPIGESQYYIYMVLNNRVYEQRGDFAVVEQPKELKITYLDFPKEVEPGKDYEIRLRVTDSNNKPVQAQLTATLYDAALDKFAKHRFYINQINQLAQFPLLEFERGYSYSNVSMALDYSEQLYTEYTQSFTSYDTIVTFDPETFSDAIQTVGNVKEGEKLSDIMNKNKPQGNKGKAEEGGLRTKLGELVFFDGYTETDEDGIATIYFTMTDALTRWNFLVAAHSKTVEIGLSENSLVCKKDLMVQPNVPRFVRQNDTIVLAATVVNQSDKTQKGTVSLEFLDVINKKTMKGFLLENAVKPFTIPAQKSQQVQWKLLVPDTAKTVYYKILAKAKKNQDGEQSYFMVLTDKDIEIRQKRAVVQGGATQDIDIPRDSSKNSRPVQLKLNICYNQSWEVLQSLPYLLEYPYECTEQLMNRVYANRLSQHILNANPDIRGTLARWAKEGLPLPIELANPKMRQAIQRQTPWLFDLGSEDVNKKRLATLLDSMYLEVQWGQDLDKVKKRQNPDGGLSWYGGESDTYISLLVLQTLGHYQKISGNIDIKNHYNSPLSGALSYVKKEFRNQYLRWKAIAEAANARMDKLDIRNEHLYFLYAESFYMNAEDTAFATIKNFVIDLLEKQWQSFSAPISLGHIALVFSRNGKKQLAETVLDTLMARSQTDPDGGRFWLKDYGFYWYQMPIETQALLIEAVAEIRPNDKKTLLELKTWLLLQREGARWATTKATAAAASALMMGGNWIQQNELPSLQLDGKEIALSPEDKQGNEGKLVKTWRDPAELQTAKSIRIKNNNADVPTFADISLYVLKPLSEIQAQGDSLFYIEKRYLKAQKDGSWKPISKDSLLKKGDKIAVELRLHIPKMMEYLHLQDQHPSGFEPVNTSSGMYYEGASHYRDIRDEATNFFFTRLYEGDYVLRHEFWVANAGSYQSGIAKLESMYAPRYKAQTQSYLLRSR